MEPVLVAWATRSGSTEELARFIAEALREHGLTVDVEPIGKVRSIEPYGALVVAAALYIGRLHRDARRFLKAQREGLMRVPVALFVPGPMQKSEKDFAGSRKQLENELARFPWLVPVAHHVVGGKFDPANLGPPWRLIPFLRRAPISDARDWAEIHAQAAQVAAALQKHAVGV